MRIKQLFKGAYSYGDSPGFSPDSLLIQYELDTVTKTNAI